MRDKLGPTIAGLGGDSTKASGLLWISTDFFTAGADVRDSMVANAPPILRWTVGRHASVLANYGRRQKARMVWMPYREVQDDE